MTIRDKIFRARRDTAMARPEILNPTSPREFAPGTATYAVKNQDPHGVRGLVERFNEKKGKGSVGPQSTA